MAAAKSVPSLSVVTHPFQRTDRATAGVASTGVEESAGPDESGVEDDRGRAAPRIGSMAALKAGGGRWAVRP